MRRSLLSTSATGASLGFSLTIAFLACLAFVLAGPAAPALAAGEGFVFVTTGQATDVGPASATLHGTVKPAEEKETTYWLEYRECATEFCSSSWVKTPEVTLSEAQVKAAEEASQGSGVGVEATVTGLSAGTSYSYRLAAKRTIVTMTAGAGSFTTGPEAPRVESEAASEVTATNAVLSASLNPGNSVTSGYVTAYHFDYERVGSGEARAFSPAGVTAANGTVASVPEALTGLAPGSEYSYWLIAENATGGVEGPHQTLTTAAAPPASEPRGPGKTDPGDAISIAHVVRTKRDGPRSRRGARTGQGARDARAATKAVRARPHPRDPAAAL